MLRAMADWDTEWKPTIMSYINKTPSMNPDMRDSFMSSMNSFDLREISMHSDLTVAPCAAIAHGTGEAKDSFETSCRKLTALVAATIYLFWNTTKQIPDLRLNLFGDLDKIIRGRSCRIAIIKTRNKPEGDEKSDIFKTQSSHEQATQSMHASVNTSSGIAKSGTLDAQPRDQSMNATPIALTARSIDEGTETSASKSQNCVAKSPLTSSHMPLQLLHILLLLFIA